MNLHTLARQLPLRLAAGSYVLNSRGSLRPTEQDIPLAKDVWLLGIGTSLIVDDVLEGRRS
ncbi:MAG: hypothetical protein ACRDRV_21675 [Pseudonocardiaceae bacterium]